MKIFRLASLLLLAFTLALRAQVTVEISPVQGQFLPGESLMVEVKITNRSGQALKFGADNEWLKISVESKEGYVINRTAPLAVQGEFTLESGKLAKRRVDIAPGFNLTKPGTYTATASVTVSEWNKDYNTTATEFDIVNAMPLRELEFGVPTTAGQAPEVRKYTLQQAHYLQQLRLYVRVSGESGNRVIRVTPLGGMVSVSEPEMQVDRASNLHVLWQNSARGFAYRVVNPAGEIIGQETHDYAGTRPKLRADEAGKIGVAGGVRHPMRDDLPPLAQP